MNSFNENLIIHDEYFTTVATLSAYLIENINMQMEAETADLLDRRMMQLFGVMHKKLDKNDFNPRNDLTKKFSQMQSKIN